MVQRVQNGNLKAAVNATAAPNVQNMATKAAITASAIPNVQNLAIKVAVRNYPIQRIAKITPPVGLTFICSCNPVCCFTYGV